MGRDQVSDVWLAQLELLPAYLSAHLVLTVVALILGIALCIPLVLLSLRQPWLQSPVMAVASAIQTVPGLALLALMVPLLGQIGFLPALIALVLYSMLPVLRNSLTGIEQVDASYVEAALGLGMTPRQLLLRVQLPLAMPVIFAGIRTAAVWVVGIATLSTPVGATSLGNFIFSGLQTQNHAAVIVGCVAAATLAMVLDRLIYAVQLALERRNRLLALGTVVFGAALLAGGLWPRLGLLLANDSGASVVIGSKTFTEQYVLSELFAADLRRAGYATDTLDSLGSTVIFDALRASRVDVYVDYTGTIWANYMGRADNPGREAIRAQVGEWLLSRYGIAVAATLGFENAYALAMTRELAESLEIRSIDDLAAHAPTLSIGADYEFFGRPEWAALMERYGLEFAERRSMDSTLMYAAVAAGEVDVISAFSTDGRIAAFDLLLLEDGREALPPYDAIVLIAPGADRRTPGLLSRMGRFDGALSPEAMQAANRHVDVDGGTVAEAARMLARSLDR